MGKKVNFFFKKVESIEEYFIQSVCGDGVGPNAPLTSLLFILHLIFIYIHLYFTLYIMFLNYFYVCISHVLLASSG